MSKGDGIVACYGIFMSRYNAFVDAVLQS